MDLESILASSCRRKILKVLLKVGETNVMNLISKANSTYSQVNHNLQILEQEEIVTENRFGRVRLIKLNRENPKTTLLLQAMKLLEPKTTQPKITAKTD
jgi:DNA-binding transcriptional ArsR family regulator